MGIRAGLREERAQATVEMAVVTPVLLGLALIVYNVMIFAGAVMPLGFVWEITDFVNLFLLVPSVYTLLCCRKILRKK